MTDSATSAIILAGGIGSRFHSRLPKVVHSILGRPMVAWMVDACRRAEINHIVVVASPGTAQSISDCCGGIELAIQPKALGTGDAAAYGLEKVTHEGHVLIAAGDTPCMTPATIEAVLAAASAGTASVLTCTLPDPGGYGRILRDAHGAVERIVEQRDATPDVLAIQEINAGMYAFPAALLRRVLPELTTDNAQNERYLVDVIGLARGNNILTQPVPLNNPEEIQGINDRVQLEMATATLRRRINQHWQRQGVTIAHPETVDVGPDVVLAPDVRIDATCALSGRTSVGAGTRIGQGCVLDNTTVGDACTLKPYVVAEDARLADGVSAGPFAHLRPGTRLDDGSRIGNFVETKNTRLGKGSKANHLTYLGDAEIGSDVNVGAGTITCNYNGAEKHLTVIEDDVFIGSDTQLVAPVRIGKGATIGAGTTVTKDVSPGALAVRRAEHKEFPGYKRKQKKT